MGKTPPPPPGACVDCWPQETVTEGVMTRWVSEGRAPALCASCADVRRAVRGQTRASKPPEAP